MKIDNDIVSPPPSFYTPKEVAAILRFKKVDQVYALCHSRVIPSFQLGRNWLIPKDELHEWLRKQIEPSLSR